MREHFESCGSWDVNSAYFDNHGGYEFAKQFYEDAYKAAVQIAILIITYIRIVRFIQFSNKCNITRIIIIFS